MEERYDDLIERIVKRILELKLEVPAILLLESLKPISFITSQFFVFLEPFVNSIFSFKNYQRFYKMLEDRENIEKIIEELEKGRERKG
ncbi:MAG: hypothetical protein ABIM49_06365 [candidate division WOR-3 bacterium]|uniref:Uncharacterized protein n=1 Tax=candidate division WOR-3 bacterium TaxID=2052148 RepID=A0A7V4E1G2_UNCW3